MFPNLCSKPLHMVQFVEAADAPAGSNKPLRMAVVLSGGQAAGGSWSINCQLALPLPAKVHDVHMHAYPDADQRRWAHQLLSW